MRTTLRIDDDVLEDLKRRAREERVSLTKMVNRVLRRGLQAFGREQPRRPYREKTFAMGHPKVDLDRALQVAAALEEEEIREKLARRK